MWSRRDVPGRLGSVAIYFSRLFRNVVVIPLPSLEDAIERHVLTVSADEFLTDALRLMRCGHRASNADDAGRDASPRRRASCVLVMAGERLEGILTERDVVKLTAAGTLAADLRVAQVMTRNVFTLCEADRPDLSSALLLLRQYRIRHLPVLDAAGNVTGLVTPASIRTILQPSNLLKMRRVRDVMATRVQSALGSVSVQKLAEQMARERVSAIVIVDIDASGERISPIGIVTERDIVGFRVANLDLNRTLAQEVMSAPLECLHPDDSLAEAHAAMQRLGVRRLVVAGDRAQLAGIVTQTSMLQAIDLSEMHSAIGTLKQLVSDRTRKLQRTNQKLRDEVAKRVMAERQLQKNNDLLEQRVRDRTAALESSNAKLHAEIADRVSAQARLQDYEEHLE
ncbi:MAG: CBS domain-containing protein, partial [Cyanobacteria bacterium J06639_1]